MGVQILADETEQITCYESGQLICSLQWQKLSLDAKVRDMHRLPRRGSGGSAVSLAGFLRADWDRGVMECDTRRRSARDVALGLIGPLGMGCDPVS
jgi:hypothetical protein